MLALRTLAEVSDHVGLQRRQLGLSTYPFQAELLDSFDAADLAGKRRILAEFWPLWRDYVARIHKRS